MSEITLPEYQSIAAELQSASLAVTPAELHGLLVGMLSGGLAINDQTWQPILFDYTNDGMGWPNDGVSFCTDGLQSDGERANGFIHGAVTTSAG